MMAMLKSSYMLYGEKRLVAKMKNVKKILNALVSIMIATSLLMVNICAAGNVSYEGEKEGFVFTPGSSNSKSDLLENFKDVVPGDEIRDSIEIKNNTNSKVRIYMKALGAESGSAELLNQLRLVITKQGQQIFNSTAAASGGLTNWCYLGEFEKGDKEELELVLEVPIELNDNFQDSIGYVRWVFKAEDLSKTPKTGDSRNIAPYMSLLGVSMSAAIVIACRALRRKDEELA